MRFPLALHGGRSQEGFTRADCVAAVFCSVLILFLAMPVLAKDIRGSRAALCLGNMRELVRAWQLYAEDHGGKLVHNFHGGAAVGGAWAETPGVAPWASGWLDWGTRTDNTNRLLILDQKYARMSSYLDAESRAHKCTEDIYIHHAQKNLGWKERVRTISMNATVGDGNARSGGWDQIYEQVKELGAFRFPGPSDVAVFFEEHPDSVNDPLIYPPQATTRWIDVPSGLHGNGMAAGFADGRASLAQWRRSLHGVPVRLFDFQGPPVYSKDPDQAWVSYHSARRSEVFHGALAGP